MNISTDLKKVIDFIYTPNGFQLSHLNTDENSTEYCGCNFELNSKRIIFRVAKSTPIKVGHFVTLWKRDRNSITQPYDVNDGFHFVVICVENQNQFGTFIFSKKSLFDLNMISKNGIGGKRGFRVYAPWVLTENAQAKKTQKSHEKYFLDFSNINSTQVKSLYDF